MMESVSEKVGSLSEGEEILGSFECRIDAMRGFLVCTNKGVKFIQGGGKYERVFKKLFETTYDKMDVGVESNNYLVITIEGESYRKRLEPIGGPISVLRKIIEPYVDIHGMPSPHIQDMRVTP
jgi:hypothetical protein